jgi:hypothetical protein
MVGRPPMLAVASQRVRCAPEVARYSRPTMFARFRCHGSAIVWVGRRPGTISGDEPALKPLPSPESHFRSVLHLVADPSSGPTRLGRVGSIRRACFGHSQRTTLETQRARRLLASRLGALLTGADSQSSARQWAHGAVVQLDCTTAD